MINWQLSKQSIHWPVSPDRIVGSGVDPWRSNIFLKLSADKLLVFKWSQAQVYFFLIHMKYVVFCTCRTIKMLISNWPRKLKLSRFLQAGKTCQLLLTFLTKVTRWSRSTSNCYAMIGKNLTGQFMRKIYAASWNLFTLLKLTEFSSTCDVFNCLFPLNVQNKIQLLSRVFCYSWLVCLLGFWLKNSSLVKVGNLLTGWGSFHQRNNSFREHNTLFSEHMRPSSYNTTRPTRNTADPYFTMTELSPINILPFKENY